MKGTYPGEFEELVLLCTGLLFDEAYGVAIMSEIQRQTGRKVNISAVHALLKRLQDKGFVVSRMDGATQQRGGRRKRLFTLTAARKKALADTHALRNRLFAGIPEIVWDLNIC